jgi:mono/diheme cytochrome c family protein
MTARTSTEPRPAPHATARAVDSSRASLRKDPRLAPWRLILGTLLIFGLSLGCDPKSDMGQQPKYKPLAPNPAFADGASARPLVAGVVPREPTRVPGNVYFAYAAVSPAGSTGTVDEAASNPRPVDATLLERGGRQFEAYCSACHGRLGNGMGMVAQRGLMHPPSFHIDRLRAAGDGHFYNVITAGYGAMYAYNDRLAPPDRWAVIAYVRALQEGGKSAGRQVADVLHGSGDAQPKTAGYRQ